MLEDAQDSDSSQWSKRIACDIWADDNIKSVEIFSLMLTLCLQEELIITEYHTCQ
jgi:hypothetical protein